MTDLAAIVGGALGGALVTAVGGFVGAAIQTRRDHQRWVREKRYEAYVKAYGLTKAFDLNASKLKKLTQAGKKANDPEIIALEKEADALYATVAEAYTPIILLGPDRVGSLALDVQDAYEKDDAEAQGKAELAFRDAARKALKIKG